MTSQPPLRQVSDLLKFYHQVRKQTWKLCEPLQPEDFVVQPMADASPTKWHLGHTTWFFENLVLAEWMDGYELFDERLNFIFNSYYESLGPRILRSARGNISRPALQVVLDYRDHVDRYMERLLQRFSDGQAMPKELHDLIVIGLNHEQQHQELLVTDLKYTLGTNPLYPAYLPAEEAAGSVGEAVQPLGWLSIEEGVYEIGYRGDGFCYDNELSPHRVYLQQYQLADRLVTNGEFLEFMSNGGYEQFQYWLSEGWEWVRRLEIKAPLYWYEHDGEWYHYTLRGLKKVDPNLPATHVSYFEADAYARWKDCRLPAETEWEAACRKFCESVPEEANFVESREFHPSAPRSATDYQFFGHVWEWTGSAYLAYPSFPKLQGALGEYNGKFMINQMVLRGGSCATPVTHIRPTYRNFFQTDKRWQFTGIRLAK